jgi:hypothetical protein
VQNETGSVGLPEILSLEALGAVRPDFSDSLVNGIMLYEFIAVNRDEIIRRCRAKVASRSVPPPTKVDIDHGVPVFLDQLGNALRLGIHTRDLPHRDASSPSTCPGARFPRSFDITTD